jgi:hypothetical protein
MRIGLTPESWREHPLDKHLAKPPAAAVRQRDDRILTDWNWALKGHEIQQVDRLADW